MSNASLSAISMFVCTSGPCVVRKGVVGGISVDEVGHRLANRFGKTPEHLCPGAMPSFLELYEVLSRYAPHALADAVVR
jgi:hypothetical protein